MVKWDEVSATIYFFVWGITKKGGGGSPGEFVIGREGLGGEGLNALF